MGCCCCCFSAPSRLHLNRADIAMVRWPTFEFLHPSLKVVGCPNSWSRSKSRSQVNPETNSFYCGAARVAARRKETRPTGRRNFRVRRFRFRSFFANESRPRPAPTPADPVRGGNGGGRSIIRLSTSLTDGQLVDAPAHILAPVPTNHGLFHGAAAAAAAAAAAVSDSPASRLAAFLYLPYFSFLH